MPQKCWGCRTALCTADIEMLTVALNIPTGELVMVNSKSQGERYKETDLDVNGHM